MYLANTSHVKCGGGGGVMIVGLTWLILVGVKVVIVMLAMVWLVGNLGYGSDDGGDVFFVCVKWSW